MILPQALAEMYHCTAEIRDAEALLSALEAVAVKVGATVLDRKVITYEPYGATVAVFLAESHLILTTWPEHDLMLVDALLCNPRQDQHVVIRDIARRFCPDGKVIVHEVQRHITRHPPVTGRGS